MSKKFIFLVILLFIAIGTFGYIKLNSPRIRQSISLAPPRKQVVPEIKMQLSFIPEKINPSTYGTTQALVTLMRAQNSQLSYNCQLLVQLEIAYEPTRLIVTSILPGNYLNNTEEVLSKIDAKNGRISYALKGSTPTLAKENNSLAVINFNSLYSGLNTETSLTFLPKTQVRCDNKLVKLDINNKAKIMDLAPLVFPSPTPSPQVTLPL
jgi:hypothetical protein